MSYDAGMGILLTVSKFIAGIISGASLLFTTNTHQVDQMTSKYIVTPVSEINSINYKAPTSTAPFKVTQRDEKQTLQQKKTNTLVTKEQKIQVAPTKVTVSMPVISKSDIYTSPTSSNIDTKNISPEALNTQTRAAVINIMCTIENQNSISPISGSGVIIDSRGVILTNAHVAQFFLLRDYPTKNNVQCVVRTGSPARALYTAELLYLPETWIEKNGSKIASSSPTGTGENDYAFLRISGTTNPDGSLPTTFPYLSMNTGNPQPHNQMLLASYPAGFLEGANIITNLYQTSAYASVSAVYVFDSANTWVDLFSVPGSMVSQSGSSGGAAVYVNRGALAGIIVTDTDATTTAKRDLHAVSIAHIDNNLRSNGMGGIADLLSGDLQVKASQFNSTIAPALTKKLISALK